MESKVVRPSVLAARTLLSGNGSKTCVTVPNHCGLTISTRSTGETISVAVPIDRCIGSLIDVPNYARGDKCVQNKILQSSTKRMKQRYDAGIKYLKLEPRALTWYYCPRTKCGHYQKWRWQSTVCLVGRRSNDLLYSFQVTRGPGR